MMMQENSKLISSHRHTDVTAIYGTISEKKKKTKNWQTDLIILGKQEGNHIKAAATRDPSTSPGAGGPWGLQS